MRHNRPKTSYDRKMVLQKVAVIIIFVALSACSTKNAARANNPDSETQSSEIKEGPIRDDRLSGVWIDSTFPPHKIVIQMVGDSIKMTTQYQDGSSETIPLVKETIKGQERLHKITSSNSGEYMVIERNGYLGFYDDQGLIYRLPPQPETTNE